MSQILSEISDTNTTIAAVSTPKGIGGIAVIRLSGPDAIKIADTIWKGKPLSNAKSHSAHFGKVTDSYGEILDEAIATVFIAPRSFTGQDTVEFSVHGSDYIQKEMLSSLVKAGATLARPGEYTRRAFLSGRLQLTQAEAVADLLSTQSRAAHRLAMSQLQGNFAGKIEDLRQRLLQLVSLLELELDFSEEDVTFADRTQLSEQALEIKRHIAKLLKTFRTGNAIRNGIPVAIVGPTNAGKSSLLNALVENDRAIVSDIHGTTRDTIEETSNIGDYIFRFVDTAGLRETNDPIERLGIGRSRDAISKAHIVLSVIDASAPEKGIEYFNEIAKTLEPHQTLIKIYNKCDISEAPDACSTTLSAKTGKGLENLQNKLVEVIDKQRGISRHTEDHQQHGSDTKHPESKYIEDSTEDVIITNQRHADILERAYKATETMLEGLDTGLPTDLVAQDAREILDTLAELTGHITTTEILTNIFSKFCIGK